MHNSVDRKGVNFKPFDALEGYKDMLDETRISYLKEEMILLSEDQIEEINRNLIRAYNKKLFVLIRFYCDGYYKFHTGHISDISNNVKFDDMFVVEKENIIEVMFV